MGNESQNLSVKEIARLAGVSAGTVDRVLHNRGNVSAKSRLAVEKVLDKYGYKYNIHASAISLRRSYTLLALVPAPGEGDYWDSVRMGIEKALKDYSDIQIRMEWAFYDQFDLYSFREVCGGIDIKKYDAAIIGPTFREDTLSFCSSLDEEEIPYVFVDALIEGTHPYASFTAPQEACGAMVCRIVQTTIDRGGSIAIMNMKRKGGKQSSNSIQRRAGMASYLEETSKSQSILKDVEISLGASLEENAAVVKAFLDENPSVKAFVVLNSRGHLMADILSRVGKSYLRTVTFDLTGKNTECLRKGTIDVVLCQRPKKQGYSAIIALIDHLLYHRHAPGEVHYMSVDIILKENLPYYKEI